MRLSILKNFYKDESAATAIEYGILVGVLSLMIFFVVESLSDELIGLLGQIEAAIRDAT